MGQDLGAEAKGAAVVGDLTMGRAAGGNETWQQGRNLQAGMR